MNNREKGALMENIAKSYLVKNGVQIKEQNFRVRQGEIDLIGYHENYLVFFEVKSRNTLYRGLPEEAVGSRKQQIICRVSDVYRLRHRLPDSTPIRYDVIAIYGDEIRWHQNAFPYHFPEKRIPRR
jgi:putative endonuclease